MPRDFAIPLYQDRTDSNASEPLAPAQKPARPALSVRSLSKWFGEEQVLDDVNFEIAEGESLVLLGHSGSGKSTTLRVIAGLETPDAGEVLLRGRHIEQLSARQRNVGVIFQNYALFPRMSVADNIGFGLRIRGVRRKKRLEVINRLLAMIGLEDQRDKLPSQISGGQQQRVAIARALAYEPDVLLFDESFSALDPQIRVSLRREIRSLLRELRVPALFITHDQDEAMELGDHIAILNRGRIEQIGTPDEVYNDPRTEFVATFLGAANVVAGRQRGNLIDLGGGRILSDQAQPARFGEQEVKVVFRPEDIVLGPPGSLTEAAHAFGRFEVVEVAFAGATEAVTLRAVPRTQVGALSLAEDAEAFTIKAARTKWDARRLRLQPGELVSVGLRSFKLLAR